MNQSADFFFPFESYSTLSAIPVFPFSCRHKDCLRLALKLLALTISKEEGLASSSNSGTLAGNALCERVDTATGESHSGMPGCRRLFAWFPVQGG